MSSTKRPGINTSGKLVAFVFGGAMVALVLGVLVFNMEDRRMHKEMDSRTLVRISMTSLVQSFDTVEMVLCGHAYKFGRETLLDTVLQNFPTWEAASKCPVRFNCKMPKGDVISFEMDSIEFHGISGEHAFAILPMAMEYQYLP